MTPVHIPGTPGWLWWLYPWALGLLLLLPLAWHLWMRRERRAAIRFPCVDAVRQAGGSRRTRYVGPVLRVAALACLIVGVARPQRPDEVRREFAEGVAILLVVDTSSSMQDVDLSPSRTQPMTRLDVVKQVIRRFVAGDGRDLPGRPNDLIGMIRFARYADSVCPLTLDHDTLLKVLDRVQIVRRADEDGTAIGDGLGLAVERMRELQRTTGSGRTFRITSRVIILLTDGENNQGMITPEQAGDLAALHGIKVYTILAGTGRRIGLGFRAPVDDSQLRYIARVTGGKHYTARDPQSLQRVYEQIDKLERTKIEERTHLRWGELAIPWLLAAFGLLSVQMLLEATWLRKIP